MLDAGALAIVVLFGFLRVARVEGSDPTVVITPRADVDERLFLCHAYQSFRRFSTKNYIPLCRIPARENFAEPRPRPRNTPCAFATRHWRSTLATP